MTDREGEMERWNMENRFNIPFLSRRLEAVTDWLIRKFEAEHVYAPIGYFGASTGSAAAIEASARHPGQIAAIVSRGGRPDLAVWSLRHIEAPTLLIVGSEDPDVLRWNEEAYEYIRAVRKLHIIKGATHLFEEPGALQHVARAAGDWFDRYLRMPRHAGG
jgi:pimeloyl-ACP methyl ester carboxylesterase